MTAQYSHDTLTTHGLVTHYLHAGAEDAPLLVLDEATSHLDTISEQAVRAALDALMVDRTTLVVAHRLSTVRAADLILVLQAGRVIEAGRHAELLARRGVYAKLVEHQMAGVTEPRRAAG